MYKRQVYAWYKLGRLYLSDEYKNIGRAVHYLKLAANQKNEFALYRLGKLYLAGEEVAKNVELAIRYLEESAGVGNQYAQYVLGKVYMMGKEVEQDKEKAYEYFRLAAEQGNVYATYFLEHWNDMPHPGFTTNGNQTHASSGKYTKGRCFPRRTSSMNDLSGFPI